MDEEATLEALYEYLRLRYVLKSRDPNNDADDLATKLCWIESDYYLSILKANVPRGQWLCRLPGINLLVSSTESNSIEDSTADAETRLHMDMAAEDEAQAGEAKTALIGAIVVGSEGNPTYDHSTLFKKELEQLINKYSMEQGCNTHDFILAGYLADCLKAFNVAVRWRTRMS